jgi:hypothetical protein
MTTNTPTYTVQYKVHHNDEWRLGVTGVSREKAMDRASEWKRLNFCFDTRVI